MRATRCGTETSSPSFSTMSPPEESAITFSTCGTIPRFFGLRFSTIRCGPE